MIGFDVSPRTAPAERQPSLPSPFEPTTPWLNSPWRIALETAPRGGGHGNIAHNPELWDRIYRGVIDVENEDPIFPGLAGWALACRHLASILPPFSPLMEGMTIASAARAARHPM